MPPKFLIKIIVLIIVALLIAVFTATFGQVLNILQSIFLNNSDLIYGLPLAGLLITAIHKYLPPSFINGSEFLLTEAQTLQTDDYQKTPVFKNWRLAIYITLSTWWTHLFGGSAGRESSALQIGGSLTLPFLNLWSNLKTMQNRLIAAGMSAGFASLFGVPWAAPFFVAEILKNYSPRLLLLSLTLSHLAHYFAQAIGLPHTHFDVITPNLSWDAILPLLGLLMLITASAWLYLLSRNLILKLNQRWFKDVSFRKNAIYSLLALGLWLLWDNPEISGLSLPQLELAFTTPVDPYFVLQKGLLTLLILAAGFKGGEVTPIFVMGAGLGSVSTMLFGADLPTSYMASLAMLGLFSALYRTPLTSTVMAAELFGLDHIPLYFCFYFLLKLVGPRRGLLALPSTAKEKR
ncbi:MAG: chloride channel protein [Bdellovibrionia bacterium]